MSAVDRLRQNDPARTSINIRLRSETSDADLAHALGQNPFVTEIWVDFQHVQHVQPTDWGSLLRVIATRETLVKINLKDRVYYPPVRRAPPALIRAFLQCHPAKHIGSMLAFEKPVSSRGCRYICGHRIFNHISLSLWMCHGTS